MPDADSATTKIRHCHYRNYLNCKRAEDTTKRIAVFMCGKRETLFQVIANNLIYLLPDIHR
jgi:hypothetical protein